MATFIVLPHCETRQPASCLYWHPTQTHYPETEPTRPCPILIMSSASPGSDRYSFKSVVWTNWISNHTIGQNWKMDSIHSLPLSLRTHTWRQRLNSVWNTLLERFCSECISMIMWLNGILVHGTGSLISQWRSTIKSQWVYTVTKSVSILVWSYCIYHFCVNISELKNNDNRT